MNSLGIIPVFPELRVHGGLCSRNSMFPEAYVPGTPCSRKPMFPELYVPGGLCSRNSVFPEAYVPGPRCSRRPMFPELRVPGGLCSRNSVFPEGYVPGTPCSRRPMFPELNSMFPDPDALGRTVPGLEMISSNQITQEVKNERFLISTRQNNVRISTYVVFNKATNGQTDIKHDKEETLS